MVTIINSPTQSNLKAPDKLDFSVSDFIEAIHETAKPATPIPKKNITKQEITYSLVVRNMIPEGLQRRIWHTTRCLYNQNILNKINNQHRKLVKGVKHTTFALYSKYLPLCGSRLLYLGGDITMKRTLSTIPSVQDKSDN